MRGENEFFLFYVIQGLQHVHSKGLVHLDIKPDNIFIASISEPPVETTPLSMDTISEMDSAVEGQQYVYKIGEECRGLLSGLHLHSRTYT